MKATILKQYMIPYAPLVARIQRRINTFKAARKQKRPQYRLYFIDHTRKLIYIENPKAASRTILTLFPSAHISQPRISKNFTHAHITVALPSYTGWVPRIWTFGLRGITHETRDWLTEKEQSLYAFFTFVRDPFDRVVSGYTNKIISNRPIKVPAYIPAPSWHAFLQEPADTNTPEMFSLFVEAYVTQYNDQKINVHFKSQCAMTTDTVHTHNMFIGKVEQFEHDWNTLADKYNLSHYKQQKENQSHNRHDTTFYYTSSDTVEKIYHRYKSDIEAFAYKEAYSTLLQHVRS